MWNVDLISIIYIQYHVSLGIRVGFEHSISSVLPAETLNECYEQQCPSRIVKKK